MIGRYLKARLSGSDCPVFRSHSLAVGLSARHCPSTAALPNYHKRNGSKQYPFIISQFLPVIFWGVLVNWILLLSSFWGGSKVSFRAVISSWSSRPSSKVLEWVEFTSWLLYAEVPVVFQPGSLSQLPNRVCSHFLKVAFRSLSHGPLHRFSYTSLSISLPSDPFKDSSNKIEPTQTLFLLINSKSTNWWPNLKSDRIHSQILPICKVRGILQLTGWDS